MKLTEIERAPLEHVDDVEAQLRGDVLARAGKLFGYHAEAFRHSGPLAAVLAELDIRPLRAEQVEDYMRGKEGKTRLNTGWLWAPGLLALIPAYWAVARLACGTWGAIGFPWAFPGMIGSILGAFTLLNVTFIENAWPTYERESKWALYALGEPIEEVVRGRGPVRREHYSRYVPIHALNLAVQVKEALPEARFYVHELTTVTRKLERPRPDPFLSVELGVEKYWLAVWDERDYEAKA